MKIANCDKHVATSLEYGFSLIEVLFAAALTALMGALILQSLTSTMDVKDAVEERSTRYHLIRQAMSRMATEISMAYLSNQKSPFEPIVVTRFKGERDSLNFNAFGNVIKMADAKESDQHELGFFIGDDPRTLSSALIRREDSSPDDEMESGGREQVLCPHVVKITFDYFDDVSADWKDSWDTDETTSKDHLPSRVRIKLTATMGESDEQTFVTQTRIMLTKPIKL